MPDVPGSADTVWPEVSPVWVDVLAGTLIAMLLVDRTLGVLAGQGGTVSFISSVKQMHDQTM